jgi:hypothetical protein
MLKKNGYSPYSHRLKRMPQDGSHHREASANFYRRSIPSLTSFAIADEVKRIE